MSGRRDNPIAKQPGGTIGLPGLLLLLFIGLKLAHVIDWAWVWVLSPLWMPIAALLAFVVVAGLIAALWRD